MDLLTTIMICGMYYTNSVTNAMIQLGSRGNPMAVTVVENNKVMLVKNDFKSRQEAAQFVRQQIDQGRQVDIGLMQIPSAWLPNLTSNGVVLSDLFLPCKNVAVGTDLLNQAEAYAATMTKDKEEREKEALSFYWTGDLHRGLNYAKQVQSYARAHPIEANPLNREIHYKQLMNDSRYDLPEPSFSKSSSNDQAATAAYGQDSPSDDQQTTVPTDVSNAAADSAVNTDNAKGDSNAS